jgi:NAD(P)-dependent dehydrogenase (short-subunit alcohol dehydrogenase family)
LLARELEAQKSKQRGVDRPVYVLHPQVDNVIQEVLKRHGRIDGVVNCVGSVVARSALATDLEELRQTIDVSSQSYQK